VNAPAGSGANLLHSKAVRKPLVHGNHFEYYELRVLQLSLISEVCDGVGPSPKGGGGGARSAPSPSSKSATGIDTFRSLNPRDVR